MIDDDLFGVTLRRAVSTLEPPTAQLVEAGMARGRQRRRIRRAVQATSGAVLFAAVAALVLALLPRAGTPGRRDDNAAAPLPTSARVVSPHSVVLPALTPQVLLTTMLAGLPRPGRTTHYTGRSFSGFVAAEFVYDDGHGAARVSVAVEFGAAAETAQQFCHDTHFACRHRVDGSTLATHRGYSRPGDHSTPREWTADLFLADGTHVTIDEWNSGQEKDAGITRPAPPFTIAQLTRWIERTHWQTAITAAQARHAAGLFTPEPSARSIRPARATTLPRCASAAKMGAAPPPSCGSPR